MKLRFTTMLALLAIVYGTSRTSSATAQLAETQDWQTEARKRLEGIYTRGEFRAASVDAQWESDSSGYRIREFDPKLQRRITALYIVDSDERRVLEKGKPAEDRRRSPDEKHLISTQGRNVFLRRGEQRTKVTDTPDGRDVSFRDFRWHPDSQRCCFIESDRTDVALRSVLVPGDPSYPGVRENRFARVSGRIEGLRVGVASVDSEAVQWIDLEVPEEGFYLGQVDWIPNSDDLLVEKISRFRNVREFHRVSPDGQPRLIYSETNEAWAVGSHEINSGAHWIQNGEAFLFISEKDGWRHAFLSTADGKTQTTLTPGDYDIIDRCFVDEAGGWYYFYASPKNGTQKSLYRVPLNGNGKLERITPDDQPGTHDYNISPNGKWAIHTYSTINDPPVVNLVSLPEHKAIRVVESREALRKRFQRLVTQPTEFVSIDIGDGVVMDASITKPNNFDATKKYPVFVYVYGEPYLQTVLDRWGAAQVDFHRVVADTGYVVVSIDNRGTHCPKGAAWRRSVFGSLGPLSTEEQAAALKQLAKMKPYVDLSRVGIWGWSGGGSNTLNAMFRKPDVYHVGIAVVPKPQPHLYNAWFQEIYMRTPEVNPEGYRKSAPINFAEGLAGKLLIVTGSGETNTHIQIIEGLVDRLIELGKPFDYMVYPNRDHGLREGKGTVVHVRMLILRYLIEHLPRGPR